MTQPATPALRYAWFVVVLLMLAHVLSFADRMILNLMVGPIRADLGISDTQMSLLQGFSFALFYTVCGLPLARLADRSNRSRLIMMGVVAWSIATAASGLAQRYVHLLIARIGVAVGEATLSPSAFSLISDYFSREKRATAISVFGMGTYIGSGLAFLLGGLVVQFAKNQGPMSLPLIGEIRSWQLVFLILGVAGLLFALLMLLVREPPRSNPQAAAMPVTQVFSALRGNARTLTCHHLGFAMIALSGYGASAWIPTYLIRVQQWTVTQVGLAYGIVLVVAGTLGILCGGRLADYWIARGRSDAPLLIGAFAALAATPFAFILYTTPNPVLIVTLLATGTFLLSMPFGAAPSGLQDIVPPAMRAQASAIYLFVLNMIGLGCGPTAVALVTDYVFHDDLAVGRSLLVVGMTSQLLGAGLLLLGLAAYRDSYARQRGIEKALVA